ncbi:response regulator [Photobacterium swingsii]|uniref:Response regulator n=1 Tax=Photobacterium swingsii TaxID=680026 RepID=A0A0J8VDG8_9GAMM|nr:response regulator [Photobacterium swingsii]KMV31533.1 chemotaxis protein CheC [Photobacterium swingsii]PSW24944.1 response regulator [Photobacterium swingsii]
MTPSVLICDDSALARKQMARALPSSLNAEVTFAVNGLDALKQLQEKQFSLMFLDLTMPEMDGYQTLQAIQEQGIDIKVVVVSGDIQPQAQSRVKALGALDFLKKPVDKAYIKTLLQELLPPPAEFDFDAPIQRTAIPALRRRDIYLEVANVAIGRAADSLARHFDVFVNLPLPNVNVFEVSELHMTMRHLASNSNMSGVCQGFSGEGIAGEALVLLSDSSVSEVMQLMQYPEDSGQDFELELLMDVSNILVGSFLKGLGQQAEVKFFQSHPVLLGKHQPVDSFIDQTSGNWRRTMTFEVSYCIENTNIKCDMLLMFVDESLPLLDNKLSYLLDED